MVAETADISFGDAWVEPHASDGRGANVVVIRSALLHDLFAQARRDGRLDLESVDADYVHATQAAGFRHRREGLALRLATRRFGLMPRKRVAASRPRLTQRRWAVYRLRQAITAASPRLFALARERGWPNLYFACARKALALYQGLAWSQGRIGRLIDRLEAAWARRG